MSLSQHLLKRQREEEFDRQLQVNSCLKKEKSTQKITLGIELITSTGAGKIGQHEPQCVAECRGTHKQREANA